MILHKISTIVNITKNSIAYETKWHDNLRTVEGAPNRMRLSIMCFLLLRIKIIYLDKSKRKAVPLEAWSGPEGSRKLRFSNFVTTAEDVGKVVSLTHWPPLPPGNDGMN